MAPWFMLTVVGHDRPGIVSRVTEMVFLAGGELGEASMTRLGGNFTIMLMIHFDGDVGVLANQLKTLGGTLGLRIHIDPAEGALHVHREPNICVTISGADRAGIVTQVTGMLSECGFNILNLESTVAGDEGLPVYVMRIEGETDLDGDEVKMVLKDDRLQGFDISVHAMETMIA